MTGFSYQNGNADITIYEDGTRHIEYEDKLQLEYPLNVDVKVMSKCMFGYNPKTGESFCDFCHESATTDGKEGDYIKLLALLCQLPEGCEIAIGCNELTMNLKSLCYELSVNGYIVNLTINQGRLAYTEDLKRLRQLIKYKLIKGLGISYRSSLAWKIPQDLLDYEHTVFHVISGIDDVDDVVTLADKGVKKILVLGEKDFGFNEGNVDLKSKLHMNWYWKIRTLFDLFQVVSFDNLGLQQLNIERFLTKEKYDEIFQGEYSFYIDAVTEEFAPSSRSADRTSWDNFSIKEYFKSLQ